MHLDDALGTAVVAGTSRAGTRSLAARGVPPEACFRIASLTKTFTSTALVLAMRDRGIPLSTPVAGLLPGLAAGPALTVERLLGQVSGLRESVDGAAVADLSLTEAARLVVRAGSGAGARWSYYNGNYFVAGAVLAALGGAPYETVLAKTLLEPWRLSRTGFGTPSHPVTGWDGPAALPLGDYPMARRPSGGLWSCVPDLLALGEGLLGDRALLEEIRRARTAPGDPMTYGLGWVLGPSGQMYVNGRLPGYRAAMLLIPDRDYVSVVLTNQQNALPAAARLLSELQKPLTGQDVAAEVDGFAA